MSTAIHRRVAACRAGADPTLIARMPSGWAVMGDPQVLTGYCICQVSGARMFADTVRTDVLFKTLSEEEIEWYIQTGEPFDKAGAYAIQGIGTFLVKRINGSYTNVVGLPVCEVIEILIREKVVGFDQPHPSPLPARGADPEIV